MVLADSHGISRAPCYSGWSVSQPYFRLLDFHHLGCSTQLLRLARQSSHRSPTTPLSRFRLFPFHSPLLGESLLLFLPPATKMFQFAGLPLACLWIQQAVRKVNPFGNLRIHAYFQLPEAFRRLPRPSSSLSA